MSPAYLKAVECFRVFCDDRHDLAAACHLWQYRALSNRLTIHYIACKFQAIFMSSFSKNRRHRAYLKGLKFWHPFFKPFLKSLLIKNGAKT